MTVTYRAATPADYEPLADMARQSWVETFGYLYNEADLNAFIGPVFGPDGLGRELSDPAFQIRLAEADGRIVGFAKIGPVTMPGPLPAPAIELNQLYVLKPWHGRGVAPALMDWALDNAHATGAQFVHLSVYAENARAKAFYTRYGFTEIGRYGFVVGNQVDDERIWSKPL
ncbi:N-acetyltransferase family protein [Sphingomonas flavalba]|uniref:GNAT family N-acetyltransferase n=1 Tax=Sphingomonas flavalba TaxID=2559804 RepID=UPI0039E063F8